METLILLDDNQQLIPIKKDNPVIMPLYSNSKLSLKKRLARKIHLMFRLGNYKKWLGSWVNEISKFKEIIIFDTGNAPYIINIIHSLAPQARIVLWYWGPVEISIDPNKIDRNICEIWTFDSSDAKKYKMNLNTQFYCIENLNRFKEQNIDKGFEVFFVGTEKNRLRELLNIEEAFNETGISTYFHIVKSGKHYKNDLTYEYQKGISYPEVLSILSKAKGILDINATDQVGLSLHPMEALFFKKKLITNNFNILNEKLYNSDNIFLLGRDDFSHIKEFIDSDYNMKDYDSLIHYYCIEEWLNRFNQKG